MKKNFFISFFISLTLATYGQGDTIRIASEDTLMAERAYNSGLEFFNAKKYQQAVDSFTKTISDRKSTRLNSSH